MIDFTCIIALFKCFFIDLGKDWSKLTNPAEMWEVLWTTECSNLHMKFKQIYKNKIFVACSGGGICFILVLLNNN